MTFQSGLTGGRNNNALFGTPVNNAILDPMQGFDADVWVIDQATGKYNLVGRFTSIQFTVRNATEPYLELNQRVPRLLDGEFQFGWVLERGMLDSRVLEQTFGYNAITRELRNNRNARFQISFSVQAPELQNKGRTVAGETASLFGKQTNSAYTAGGQQTGEIADKVFHERLAIGEYLLTFCKVDSFTLGINAGRNVIANRWEGMCEGVEFIDRSIVDAGVFLDAGSSNGITSLSRGAETGKNIIPFAWDRLLYADNVGDSLANGNRTTNPLEAGINWGGRFGVVSGSDLAFVDGVSNNQILEDSVTGAGFVNGADSSDQN